MKRGGLIKFVIVMGLVVALLVGCSVLLRSGGSNDGGGGDESELTTMTFEEFNQVQLGVTKKELEDEFGQSVPRQTVLNAGVISDDPLTQNCVYYKADPPTFGEWFEFCFEGSELVNKNSL